MDQVAKSPDTQTAQRLSEELWDIWMTAPDETAQEMLRRGMERRNGYDFSGAVADFSQLIEYCPDYAEGYNQRAFISFLRKDFETALEDLDRTLALTPDHIGAVSGRALTLLQLGREYEGQIALRQALLLNPWLPEKAQLRTLPADPSAPGSETDKTDL